MSTDDRIRWDNIYTQRSLKPYPNPDPLLFEYTPPVIDDAPKLALDLAGGVGQNALWLVAQGYTVDLMDISRVALSRAREVANERNLREINLIQADLDTHNFMGKTYDLVCVFRYLQRNLLRQLPKLVAPNGRLIYQTFNLRYLDIVPDFNVDYLLQGDEILTVFKNWQHLYYSAEQHITQFVAINAPPKRKFEDDF